MSTEQKLLALLRLLGIAGQVPNKTAGIDALRKILASALGGNAKMPRSSRELLEMVKQVAGQSSGRSASGIPIPPRMGAPGQPPQRPPGPAAGESRSVPGNQLRTYNPQGFPEEQPMFSEEFLSPESSNVYSFQYFRRPHDKTGILYVCFKASHINRRALSGGPARRRGGRAQLHGELGRTVMPGRENAPGPTYAYFAVSPAVFTRMKNAASKGKFVWDELRIRGTVYGHRYRYQLVVGQLISGIQGAVGQYIPRKATKRGFVTRAVADVGTGRRSFVSSTLPPTGHGGGFTTRRRSGF